jgi:hypothetical protein
MAAQRFPELGRVIKFGRTAWRGRATCQKCGRVLTHIPFKERGALAAQPGEGGGVVLRQACVECDLRSLPRWQRDGLRLERTPVREGSGFLLTGAEAQHVLRRVLAYHNFAGAKERDIHAATRLVQEVGGVHELTRKLSTRGARIGVLPETDAIALEIAANEDRERELLELEVGELERRWREEEEIAAIVDGELTWLPLPPRELPG